MFTFALPSSRPFTQPPLGRTSRLARALAAGVAFPLLLAAQPVWNHAFEAEGMDLVGLDAASFFIPSFEGYVLVGEPRVNPGQAIARFDSVGVESWNVRLEVPEAGEDTAALSPDGDNPGRFYATYFDPDASALHFGLFHAADRSAAYAHSFVTEVGFERLSTSALPGSGGAIVQTLANGIEVLAFDGAGSVIFHQRYTGTVFDDLGTASSAYAQLAPYDAGYVLLVETVGMPETDPETFVSTSPRAFIIAHLSASGSVVGATSFSDTSANPVPPFFHVLPTGAVIAASSEFTFNPTTLEVRNSVRYLHVGPDRLLKWAFALEDAAPLGFFPDPAGNELYLAGLFSLPDSDESETDAVLIRLDLSSGAVLGSARIDLEAFDSAFISIITDDAVYTTVNGSDLGGITSSTVVRLPRDLSSAAGVAYTGSHDYAYATLEADRASLVLSVVEGSSVRAVSLGADLSIPIDCPDLSPRAITVTSGVTPGAFAPSLTPVTLAATARTTSLGTASFTFEDFTYTATEDFCVEGGGGSGDSGPEIAVIFRDDEWMLTIPSVPGTTYLINTSSDLDGFLPTGSLVGDGSVLEYPLTLPADGSLFIRVDSFAIP
jgi:hypothetical protein